MANAEVSEPDVVDASPTKAFFVDMLVKDIPLERAVLDLVDNCVDGAMRLRGRGDHVSYDGLKIEIRMTGAEFRILDNCGGFSSDVAKQYAFRFGRKEGAARTDYSIGQFGVGMKRALFKFGRHFCVTSRTANEEWIVEVEVPEWEETAGWSFPISTHEQGQERLPEDGTEVFVGSLRDEVSSKFGSESFQRSLAELIRVAQRQFIRQRLDIWFNGSLLTTIALHLLGGEFSPAVETFEDSGTGDAPVSVRIVAGVGVSAPNSAGWYVVCNARVVLAADRSEATGWGRIAENPTDIPKYHNQFARFRGVVYFECADAERLPWNTTKTGIDADAPVWRAALERMVVMARSVIDFLNTVQEEREQKGPEGPLQRALAKTATFVEADTLVEPSALGLPAGDQDPGPPTKRISYVRPEADVSVLMDEYGLRNPKQVGERTFDDALRAVKA